MSRSVKRVTTGVDIAVKTGKAQKQIPRRYSASINGITQFQQGTEARFTCKCCHKVFVKEYAFLEHRCKQMIRLEEFKTPIGQSAWQHYQMWMRQQQHMIPPPSSFLASRYFRTFINFVKFSTSVHLPFIDKFIWLMIHKKYPPTIWTNDDVYAIYIEFLDLKASPFDQVQLSIQTLMKLADNGNVDVSSVFDVITPTNMIQLLRTRRLSPWLLLFSSKFKVWFVNNTSNEQKMILESIIRPDYWSDRIDENVEDVDNIKLFVAEMEI